MKDDNKPILFYGHTCGEFAAFSNFYPAEFVLDGWTWACSEQAYMYFKSDDIDYQKSVKHTKDPYAVKKIGRKAKLRKGWDSRKFDVMVRVLEAKFEQNEDLKSILLSTGDIDIHEDCKDPWWGGGQNFPGGRDYLGKALIEVRKRLRSKIEK